MTSRAAQWTFALADRSERRSFLPAVGVFPLLDYAVPVMPNQMLLLGLSALLPRRWPRLVAVFALAGGLGALVVAFAVQGFGPAIRDFLVGDAAAGAAAARVLTLIEAHGLWALTALAMLPWPPRSGVLVCSLAGLPPVGIGAAVALGRVVSSSYLALIGAKAPRLLRRWGPADRLFAELEAR